MGKRKHRGGRQSSGMVMLAVLVVLICVAVMMMTAPAKAPETSPTAVPPPTPVLQAEPTAALSPEPTAQPTDSPTPLPTATPEPTPRTLVLSAAGDCTLGGDMNGASERAFMDQIYADADPMTYCFRNVEPVFREDDITVVNLEVVLTESSAHSTAPDKIFIMRGKPEYVNMLPAASIEVANIANNHLTDFGEEGIRQTAALLNETGVGCCGYGYTYTTTVNGLTVGFAGFNTWTTKDAEIEETLTDLRARCDVLIASFHWGTELEYNATEKQVRYGHMAVDLGADLVLGHHPHVIGGIEVYKGVNIVYSLGNFCFGGKRNPTDKDTFIYRHTFSLDHSGQLTGAGEVIPCKITSVADESYNNYQPTPVADPAEAQKILKKIEKYSTAFDTPLKLTDEE